MKKNIACPCGSHFSINYDEEVDLDKNPEILENILKGVFMSYNCSACSKKHKPEFKITVIWNSKNLKMRVLPELERGEFYLQRSSQLRNKKEKDSFETIIGFPEMADRLAVIKDDLDPVVIEALKSYLLIKAAENYPKKKINAWYHCKGPQGIEFHLDGIRADEVAVMIVPQEIYDNTDNDYKKKPKKDPFPSLRVRSYLSVQNIMRPNMLK